MLEYEFVTIEPSAEGYSFMGGIGIRLEGHQEVIREKAAEGWRYAGFLPTKQRAGGYICEIELIFCRETNEH